jgi:hypothetical protein
LLLEPLLAAHFQSSDFRCKEAQQAATKKAPWESPPSSPVSKRLGAVYG